MKRLLIPTLVAVLAAPVAVHGQDPVISPQAHFDAGRYDEAIAAAAAQQADPAPETTFLVGRSHLRMNRPDEARTHFSKLTANVDTPTAWSLVGESALALVDANTALAIEKANQAATLAPDQFHPHYQLGLAYSAAEQWEPAANALERASVLNPAHAYAHYFAGLAYSRLRRIDRMATHLEYFLKLAPNAPEQTAVLSLMRSVRGL